MAISAKNKFAKKNITREQPESGTHMARLVGLTDLGHQPGFTWQGKEILSSWKVEFIYELVNTAMADGRPFWLSEEVAVNDFEGEGITSTMMARVRVMDKDNATEDGKDLTLLLGSPCMVTVSLSDKGYAKLKGQAAVSGTPLGMQLPALKNETFAFDMDSPSMDIFDRFSDFTKKKLRAALNFDSTELAKQLAENDEY